MTIHVKSCCISEMGWRGIHIHTFLISITKNIHNILAMCNAKTYTMKMCFWQVQEKIHNVVYNILLGQTNIFFGITIKLKWIHIQY
jgi:hypothetical protein